MNFNPKNIIFVVCLLLFVASPALGAQMFFGTSSKEVGLNQKFTTGVFLNTHNESINAVEGHINFPKDALLFEGTYTGNSLLTFWIQKPEVTSPGVVTFSAIVPGGFVGAKGYLFSLLFKPTKTGEISITSSDEKVLLNDGEGTMASLTKAPLTLTVLENTSSQSEEFMPLYDAESPEDFQPQIGKDPNLFDNHFFLAFAAQDKASGIDHYEVKEVGQLGSFESLFENPPWVLAQSPYVLEDQSLQKVIYVKAVDMAGNEKIVKVKATHLIPLYENYFFWSIILLITVIIGYKKWKKRFSH